jgi:hypothetical protein
MSKYETFCDESFYGMWAVRPIGEKRWGYCYHVPSKEEADGLCAELTERDCWREVATGLANTVKTLAGAECELDPDEDSPPEWRDVIAVVAAFDALKAKENQP